MDVLLSMMWFNEQSISGQVREFRIKAVVLPNLLTYLRLKYFACS